MRPSPFTAEALDAVRVSERALVDEPEQVETATDGQVHFGSLQA